MKSKSTQVLLPLLFKCEHAPQRHRQAEVSAQANMMQTLLAVMSAVWFMSEACQRDRGASVTHPPPFRRSAAKLLLIKQKASNAQSGGNLVRKSVQINAERPGTGTENLIHVAGLHSDIQGLQLWFPKSGAQYEFLVTPNILVRLPHEEHKPSPNELP